MLFFCLLYIGYLSKVAVLIVLGLGGIAVFFFLQIKRSLDQELRQVNLAERQLLESLGHVVDGFKELKVNQRKSEAIVLRILGVGNSKLRGILLSEFLVLGFLARSWILARLGRDCRIERSIHGMC